MTSDMSSGETPQEPASDVDTPDSSAIDWIVNWLLRLLLLATVSAAILSLGGYSTDRIFTSEEIQAGQGRSFSVDLGTGGVFFTPRALDGWSAARPYEDGRPLGPKAKHAGIIAEQGRGHYRHIGQTLHFSASDLTDPRTNGRSYSAGYRLHLRAWIALALTLVTAFAVMVAARARRTGSIGNAIAGRLASVFFGLRPGLVGRSAALCAGVIIAVLVLSNREIAYAMASLMAGLAGVTVFLGLAGGAGILLARGALNEDVPLLPAILQATVLLLLAMGLQRDVLSIAQIVVLLLGLSGYAWARRDEERLRSLEGRLAALTATGESVEPGLVRRVAALAMGMCFLSVLPNVIRFWDQSGWNDSDGYDTYAHTIASGLDVAGNGAYMPLYQYGLAAFYWAFGHVFFVQQIVNIGLAVAATGCIAATAWILFRQPLAVLVAGAVAAVWRPFHHATWTTQIEGWYIPLFALSALVLAHYLRRRSLAALTLLAIVAALVFNMRLQGAFYAAALGLAVLFAYGLDWRTRFRQLLFFALMFAVLGVGPWTVRNGLIEGRYSPSSEQSISALAFYNDPRIPLYGIRYWENLSGVVAEWSEKYPDNAERKAAQRQYFYDRLINDTGYFLAAAPWRFLAFYGLLPPGALAKDGPRATDWAGEGWRYVRRKALFWAPIAVSLVGWLATIGSRLNLLFAGLILSNIIVAFSTGFSEPRLAFPVFILHLLMGCAVFATYGVDRDDTGEKPVFRTWLRPIAAFAFCLAVILPLAHLVIGRDYAFRPLMSEAWVRDPAVSIDRSLPKLAGTGRLLTVDGETVASVDIGGRYRARVRVSGQMHSPRWICCRNDFVRRMSRSDGVTFFTAYFKGDKQSAGTIALRFTGTRVPEPIREGSEIDVELRVDWNEPIPGYPARFFANAEAAIVTKKPGR